MNLNFKPDFVQSIQDGTKRITIRAPRKDGRVPKPGENLILSTGARTKNYRRLREVVCYQTARVNLDRCNVFTVDGKQCSAIEREYWAKLDGFKSFTEMLEWFKETHGLPFTGRMIQWNR